MDKIKSFFREENAAKIFESKEFVWVWLAIVFICWITVGLVAGFIIAAVLAGIILCLCRDTLPVTTILWTFLFILGANRHKLQGMAGLIAAVLFIVVGIIVNVVRFRPNFRFMSYKTVTATTVAILAFCATAMLSGIARGERYLNFSEHGLYATVVGALCVMLALCYVFFSATISGGEDGKRILNHLLFLMFASSVVIVLQLIVYYAMRGGGFKAVIDGFMRKDVELGWGGPNNYSIILAMMTPATLYFAVKNGKYSPLYLIYAVVQYFFIFASASRGAILFGAFGLIASFGLAIYKSEFRGRMIITTGVLMAVTTVVLMAKADVIYDSMGVFMGKALDENGRIPLWKDAWKNFKANPIFGTGFDYYLGGHNGGKSDGYTPYWYHSTFFQALAATGIVGFLAWVNLEVSRLRAFLTNVSLEKWFMLFGYAVFWLYGMVDVFYYTPNGLLFLFVITLAIEKSVESTKLRPYSLVYIERKRQQKLLTKNAENEK